MKRTLAVAVLAICGLWLPASAGEGYVGLSYIDTEADFGTSASGVSYDASSDGWKLFGGYNLMKYFGVEATYYSLGSFDETIGSESISADVQVFDLCGRGILPIGKVFSVFARLGYSSVKVDLDVTDTVPMPMTNSASTTDWELLYGIGIGVNLGRNFGLRAEWESWDVETSLDAWSLGVVYRFGGN